jgi:hypothetical protein
MKANPVMHCTLIIRSQVEYSITAQELIPRYMVAMPANGQHRGFTDIDALLAAVRAELLAMQSQMMPPKQEKG